MTCGDCKHFVLYGDNDKKGTCYRFPPEPAPRGPGVGGRPMVWATEQACGEFKEEEKP